MDAVSLSLGRSAQSSSTAVSQNAIEEQIPFCVRLPRYDSSGPVGKKREVAETESLGLGRATEVTGRYMIVRCREIETLPLSRPPSPPPFHPQPALLALPVLLRAATSQPPLRCYLAEGLCLLTLLAPPLSLPPLTPGCPTSAPSRGPTRTQYQALYKRFRICCITDTCLMDTCTVRRVFSGLRSMEYWPFAEVLF